MSVAAAGFGGSSDMFEEPVADCKTGWMLGIVIAVVRPSGVISNQPSRCVSW